MQQLLSEGASLSLVIPVYGNEGSIPDLLDAIDGIADRAGAGAGFEAIFVVDGSPDESFARLREQLPGRRYSSRLLALSRNFGAFSAIRAGLEHARGQVIAVMAADLQEPPELVTAFHERLRDGNADVAFGVRESRDDPWTSRLASNAFWAIYRRVVMPAIPKGGVDIFALTAAFRDELIAMRETNTSLLAQLFWLGGRRVFVPYARRARKHGVSGWTFRKKLKYLADSVFAFTDLPVRVLIGLGAVGLVLSVAMGLLVVGARISGLVQVPGYAGTMVAILFFGALNSLGLGVVGTYAWRAFENTKARPIAVVQSDQIFQGVAE